MSEPSPEVLKARRVVAGLMQEYFAALGRPMPDTITEQDLTAMIRWLPMERYAEVRRDLVNFR